MIINKDNIDFELIKNCAEKAQLERFISNLSQGYKTFIGERGIKLSGRKKQRIGIARALINNPDLIIFDEATSGLDIETENKVLDTIKKINRTSVIVSHRFNALKNCDKIYLLKNKKLTLLKNNKIKAYFEN